MDVAAVVLPHLAVVPGAADRAPFEAPEASLPVAGPGERDPRRPGHPGSPVRIS